MTNRERVAAWRAAHPEAARRQTREAVKRHRDRLHRRAVALTAALAAYQEEGQNDHQDD